MNRLVNIIMLYMVVFILSAKAEDSYPSLSYRFRWMNTSNGLSQNVVNCVLQDGRGYTWIGTNHGLNRYDGQYIRTFLKADKGSFALSNDVIKCLSLLRDGSLVIGTLNGLTIFSSGSDKSEFIYLDNLSKNDEDKCITYVFEVAKNKLLIGTRGGIFYIDLATKRFIRKDKSDFSARPELYSFNVWNIIPYNNIFLGFIENKIYEVIPEKLQFTLRNSFPVNVTFAGVKAGGNSSSLLCFGKEILCFYHPDDNKVTADFSGEIKTKKFIIESAVMMNENNLLAGVNTAGLLSVSVQNNKAVIKRVLLNNSTAFSGRSRFGCMLKDNQKLLWVGTDYGIFYSQAPMAEVRHYYANESAGFYLKDNSIRAAYETRDGKILLGSNSGISLYKPEEEIIITPPLLWNNKGKERDNYSINAITENNESVWVAGLLGVAQINSSYTAMNTFIPQAEKGIKMLNRVWGLAVANDTIFTCNLNGDFAAFGISSKKIIGVKSFNNQILFQLKNIGKKILIAARGGVIVVDKKDFSSVFISLPSGNKNTQTNALVCLKNNTWMVATEGTGIFLLDAEMKKFIPALGKYNLLADKVIYSLGKDREGNIWAGSNDGLYRINYPGFTIEHFTINDGLQENEFTYGSPFCLLRNGDMLTGGVNGFNIFNPDKIKNTTVSISPCMNECVVNATQYFHPMQEVKHFEAGYEDKFVKFRFDFPSPLLRDKIDFYTQINNGEWHNLGKSGEWIFSDFTPGNYTVKFRASLSETGIRVSKESMVLFTVLPAFYQTLWFRILVAILISIAIVFIFYYFYQRQLSANKLLSAKLSLSKAEHEITEANLAAVRAQMNPHFIFNALSSIQTLIFKNDKEGSINYLQKFAKLVRYILEKSGEQLVELDDEIKFLTAYLDMQKLRHTNLEISITNYLPENWGHQRIPAMVIQPFLENAIEHAFVEQKDAAKLILSFKAEENTLHVLLTDNGVGYKNSGKKTEKKNHKSFGINAVKKRLESISKKYNSQADVSLRDLSESSEGLRGTEVKIILPVIK